MRSSSSSSGVAGGRQSGIAGGNRSFSGGRFTFLNPIWSMSAFV